MKTASTDHTIADETTKWLLALVVIGVAVLSLRGC